MDTQNVVNSFLNSYYESMMSNRQNLINFYTEESCMSYERTDHRGLKAIAEKIQGLTFKNIEYKFENYDVQPSPIQGGLVIFVTGQLLIDKENNFNFAQTFQLLPNNQGGYFIFNDIMRLVYQLIKFQSHFQKFNQFQRFIFYINNFNEQIFSKKIKIINRRNQEKI